MPEGKKESPTKAFTFSKLYFFESQTKAFSISYVRGTWSAKYQTGGSKFITSFTLVSTVLDVQGIVWPWKFSTKPHLGPVHSSPFLLASVFASNRSHPVVFVQKWREDHSGKYQFLCLKLVE